MQGTLTAMDVRSIFQLIELEQRTGVLLVKGHQTLSLSQGDDQRPTNWMVFCVQGKIIYAIDDNNNLDRLKAYLHYYQLTHVFNQLQDLPEAETILEYDYIWHLVDHHILKPIQAANIIKNMVQEVIFELCNLQKGWFIFHEDYTLEPQITSLEIMPLLINAIKHLQHWKQFYPYIQCSHQCPVIINDVELSASLTKNAYLSLSHWADGKTSLRQLSRYLNCEILTLGKVIYNCVHKGWIKLLPPHPETWQNPLPEIIPEKTVAKRIMIINDDLQESENIEQILKPKNYELIVSNDAINSLSLMFQLQPNLIICDIDMPKLNGYELCAMLRTTTSFEQTPMIMVGNDKNPLEPLKAKMIGANDYLLRPFASSNLVKLVEQSL